MPFDSVVDKQLARDASMFELSLPRGWKCGHTGTLRNIDMYYFNEETGEKVKSRHEMLVRHVAAEEGLNTKKSRDSLLAEKGPQLAECKDRFILRSFIRQISAEKLSPASSQNVAIPFGDVTAVPGSQGLAASTAHDAGKGEGAATASIHRLPISGLPYAGHKRKHVDPGEEVNPSASGGSNFQSYT